MGEKTCDCQSTLTKQSGWVEEVTQVGRIKIIKLSDSGGRHESKGKRGFGPKEKGDTFEVSWQEKDEGLYEKCAKFCFHWY